MTHEVENWLESGDAYEEVKLVTKKIYNFLNPDMQVIRDVIYDAMREAYDQGLMDGKRLK